MTAPLNLSFEFFPPKTEAAEKALWDSVDALCALKPAFITLTYGAGGSTRNKTVEIAGMMAARTGMPTGAHLTSICTPKEDVRQIAEILWNSNVRHIIALRGDLPKDPSILEALENADCYHHANELVTALRTQHPFEISVAAYPEKHPEALSPESDIQALKTKCEAGATRAITQFFFDNDIFFRFRDKAVKAGIKTPVVPGLLPIGNYERMLSFAHACQTSVPADLRARFDAIGSDPDRLRAAAVNTLAAQIRGLRAQGVNHVHFYTLNRADLIADALEAA